MIPPQCDLAHRGASTPPLTVTSFPRLISARTFLIPSPLPTCQMVASTGWLVIGQSLAWSSYQMVLKGGNQQYGHSPEPVNCKVKRSQRETILLLMIKKRYFGICLESVPKGVDVCSVGEGQAVLVVSRAHPAYDLWRQVTDPAMWKLQLIVSPVKQDTHTQSPSEHPPAEMIAVGTNMQSPYLPS